MQVGAFLAVRKLPTPAMPASLSVRSAASHFTKLDRKAAMVMRAEGSFCGVVSQASLIAAIARYGNAAFDQPVGDAALDRDIACCSIHDTLSNVFARLNEEGRSFLCVTSRFSLIDLVFREELADRLLLCTASIA